MKAFTTKPDKRTHWPARQSYIPMKNRGAKGKQRAVNKWRSRKAKRRKDKTHIEEL